MRDRHQNIKHTDNFQQDHSDNDNLINQQEELNLDILLQRFGFLFNIYKRDLFRFLDNVNKYSNVFLQKWSTKTLSPT